MQLQVLLGKILVGLAASGVVHATLIDLKVSSSKAKSVLQQTQFDYIVVGGGAAGLTVARRLTDSLSTNVLVLEAGRSGVGDDLVTIPQNSFAFVGTDIDWGYNISPQIHANNQTINLSSGKILGGGTAVNGLVWSRGAKVEYDAIEQLGNPSWNWDNWYSYMRKSERLNIPSPELVHKNGYVVNPASHGSNGPVNVSFPAFLPIQHTKLVEASVQLGHTFNADPYTGNNTGVYFTLCSQTKNAVRVTSEFAYLDPELSRPNLVVLMNAMVTDLDVSSSNGTVTAGGVEVRFPDNSTSAAKIKSSGEVILSAGTIRTPQLLELAGIGNPNILKPLGIDVKIDLPGVGENFEDHTLTILTYKLKPGFLSFDALGYNATLKAEQEALYPKNEGFLTFAQAVLNFEPIEKILTADEMKTAQSLLITKPPSISQDQFAIIKDQIFSGVSQVEYLLFNSFSAGAVKEPNTSYISMAVTHVHPLSRGNIHITSTSIDDYPTINLNAFEAEWDNWILAKASAYARKFFQTEAYMEIVDPVEIFPGSAVSTDAQWQQVLIYIVEGS